MTHAQFGFWTDIEEYLSSIPGLWFFYDPVGYCFVMASIIVLALILLFLNRMDRWHDHWAMERWKDQYYSNQKKRIEINRTAAEFSRVNRPRKHESGCPRFPN